ncbi:hypothetical protein Droror1_Dr00025707 [Drosera rotundifolia]
MAQNILLSIHHSQAQGVREKESSLFRKLPSSLEPWIHLTSSNTFNDSHPQHLLKISSLDPSRKLSIISTLAKASPSTRFLIHHCSCLPATAIVSMATLVGGEERTSRGTVSSSPLLDRASSYYLPSFPS